MRIRHSLSNLKARPAQPGGVCRRPALLKRGAERQPQPPSTASPDTGFSTDPLPASLPSPNYIPSNTKQDCVTNCLRLGSAPEHDPAPASGRSSSSDNRSISRAPTRESICAAAELPKNLLSQGPALRPFPATALPPSAVRRFPRAVALPPYALPCSVPAAAASPSTPIGESPSASPRQTCGCLGSTTRSKTTGVVSLPIGCVATDERTSPCLPLTAVVAARLNPPIVSRRARRLFFGFSFLSS